MLEGEKSLQLSGWASSGYISIFNNSRTCPLSLQLRKREREKKKRSVSLVPSTSSLILWCVRISQTTILFFYVYMFRSSASTEEGEAKAFPGKTSIRNLFFFFFFFVFFHFYFHSLPQPKILFSSFLLLPTLDVRTVQNFLSPFTNSLFLFIFLSCKNP